MAVRTKLQLQTMQASMFADNSTGDITPEDLRDLLGDLIDSLSAGISHFSATGTTYSNVAHTISLGAPGYEGDTGTIVFWIAPSDLGLRRIAAIVGHRWRDAAAAGRERRRGRRPSGTPGCDLRDASALCAWRNSCVETDLNARGSSSPSAGSVVGASLRGALSDETADEIIAGGVTLAWIQAGYAAAS